MNCAHRDCGCRYGAPCCLNCPLAQCVLEIASPRTLRLAPRNRAIATYNQSARRTAAHFGLSLRAIYHIRRHHKLAYNRRHAAWNKTPKGRQTRRTWRLNHRPAHAAYMRTYRARRAQALSSKTVPPFLPRTQPKNRNPHTRAILKA